jgi:hypothetical protein
MNTFNITDISDKRRTMHIAHNESTALNECNLVDLSK